MILCKVFQGVCFAVFSSLVPGFCFVIAGFGSDDIGFWRFA